MSRRCGHGAQSPLPVHPSPDLCQSARSVPVLHSRRPIRVETSLSAAQILGSALSALQRITIFRLEARLRPSAADGWTAARERRRVLVGRWRARHPCGVGLRGQGRCYRGAGIGGSCAVDRAHGLNSSSSSAHATSDAGSRLNSDSVFPRPAERKIQFVSQVSLEIVLGMELQPVLEIMYFLGSTAFTYLPAHPPDPPAEYLARRIPCSLKDARPDTQAGTTRTRNRQHHSGMINRPGFLWRPQG